MTIHELPPPKEHDGTVCGRFCAALALERLLVNPEVVLNLKRVG